MFITINNNNNKDTNKRHINTTITPQPLRNTISSNSNRICNTTVACSKCTTRVLVYLRTVPLSGIAFRPYYSLL